MKLSDLNPYAIYFKLAGAALGALALFGGGMWLEGTIKDKEIMRMQRDDAQQTAVDTTAAITTLQRFISGMHVAAADYGKNQDILFAALDELNKRFRDATKNHPLPVDCKPDDLRMQHLFEAISAANGAASPARRGAGESLRSNNPAVP